MNFGRNAADPMKKGFFACLLALIGIFCAGCCCKADLRQADAQPQIGKFRKLYTFYTPKTEADIALMKKYHVVATSTDTKPETLKLLHEAGIRAYAGFGPVGWHKSQLTPEQKKVHDYLNGVDLAKDKDRWKTVGQRMKNGRYSYGGEPLAGVRFCGQTEVFREGQLACFVGEKSRAMAREKLDRICRIPGIDGIAFDFVGYTNYQGCEHPECQKLCREYLQTHKLADTKENRAQFFLGELVAYYDSCAEHIRSINPELKIMAHLYPVFLPDPLYGNRLNIDVAGETCAWYMIWDPAKVEDHAKRVVANQHKYHRTTQCVPFIAITCGDWADEKTPEIVDKELQAILKSGTDTLMIHEFGSLIRRPEIMAVFDRYFE